MADVVVTVPKGRWSDWIDEGDLPGDDWSGDEFGFYLFGGVPDVAIGERIYVVAFGRLRGYAPLTRVVPLQRGIVLAREGGAVACTIDEPITGFRGWRYRWWEREDEKPFSDWRTP